MNYTNPRLRDLLAGEYVLGTLRGSARRRFERLLHNDASLRQLVEAWEMKLNLMVLTLPPVAPPARVWHGVRRRIAGDARVMRPWWNRLGLWRAIAVAGLVASIGLSYLVSQRLDPISELQPPRMALLTNVKGKPAWLITLLESPAGVLTLHAVAIEPPAVEADRSLELWLLPPEQGAPVSAGLLPASGRGMWPLPAASRQALERARAVAVSVEPSGGSRTGAPTGPVIYQGEIFSL